MKPLKLLGLFLITAGCASQMATAVQSSNQDFYVLEVQNELSEIKRQVSSHQVDLQILEEKLAKNAHAAKAPPHQNLSMTFLEKKIAELEKAQNKIISDLRELSSHANQTTSSLRQYAEKIHACEYQTADMQERLGEIIKLKSTLSSITKAMGNSSSSKKTHKVRSGDSLEKIARSHNTTIEEIKKLNGLTQDMILIDQELKVP